MIIVSEMKQERKERIPDQQAQEMLVKRYLIVRVASMSCIGCDGRVKCTLITLEMTSDVTIFRSHAETTE